MNKLRKIIREELQKLTELGIDRGFLNGFAEELEHLTGNEAYPKENVSGNEDVVNYKGKLDIYFRSGGSRGGRTSDVSIQILDRSGRVRSGFTAPNDPEEAAERTAEELSKLNEGKLTEGRLRSIVREEISRLTEAENLHNAEFGMHPVSFLTAVADRLGRETGRDAVAVPVGETVSGAPTDDSVIIFEGKTQNVYISLEATRGGVSGHIRTKRGDLLRSFDTGQADPDAVVARATSALRDVGEL